MNVLYIPDMKKNLVFVGLFSKKGFKVVIEFDKFVFMKGVFLCREK